MAKFVLRHSRPAVAPARPAFGRQAQRRSAVTSASASLQPETFGPVSDSWRRTVLITSSPVNACRPPTQELSAGNSRHDHALLKLSEDAPRPAVRFISAAEARPGCVASPCATLIRVPCRSSPAPSRASAMQALTANEVMGIVRKSYRK
jgi:hypothetical protein